MVEHRPAILFYESSQPSQPPAYFMLLTWDGAKVAFIRDYRYVPYVIRDAELEEGLQ